MTIPLTILGGYLGTGKTTLLNRLLADPQGERLALIINDFGAINIDAALIESQADDQINLTNGCVCCGMSAGFDEALAELLAHEPLPDRIIVEASGVADVVSLAQYGYHGGLRLDGVIVLADAETVRAKTRDKYVGETVKRQLRGADLIILNKTDLIAAASVEALQDWLAELAPGIPVVPAVDAEVPRALLFDLSHDPGAALLEAPRHEHEHYATWAFETETPLPRAAVDAFLAELPAWVIRAKGFLKLADEDRISGSKGPGLVLQKVGQRQNLSARRGVDRTRIVLIGLAGQFEGSELEELASRHLRDFMKPER